MKFGCNWPSSFRRRTTEPAYTISSPGAVGSGELKTVSIIFKDFFDYQDFLKIPGQFKDKLHFFFFRIPGIFQDQGHFPGLFKVCANPDYANLLD